MPAHLLTQDEAFVVDIIAAAFSALSFIGSTFIIM